jgi:hypothetical protein
MIKILYYVQIIKIDLLKAIIYIIYYKKTETKIM